MVMQPLEADDVRRVLAKCAPELPPNDTDELVRLADGSPGRALALAAAGGLDLLHEVEAVLAPLPKLDAGALERLADKTARGGEEAQSALREMLLWWLAERVKRGAGTGAGGLDRWARLWENTRRLFERAEAASLDRKQALLEIFYDIQATARAA